MSQKPCRNGMPGCQRMFVILLQVTVMQEPVFESAFAKPAVKVNFQTVCSETQAILHHIPVWSSILKDKEIHTMTAFFQTVLTLILPCSPKKVPWITIAGPVEMFQCMTAT